MACCRMIPWPDVCQTILLQATLDPLLATWGHRHTMLVVVRGVPGSEKRPRQLPEGPPGWPVEGCGEAGSLELGLLSAGLGQEVWLVRAVMLATCAGHDSPCWF